MFTYEDLKKAFVECSIEQLKRNKNQNDPVPLEVVLADALDEALAIQAFWNDTRSLT